MIHVVVDAWGIAELGAIATAGADDAGGPDGGTVLLRLLARVEPAHGGKRPAQCDIDRRRHSVVIVFVHGCKIIKKYRNVQVFRDLFLMVAEGQALLCSSRRSIRPANPHLHESVGNAVNLCAFLILIGQKLFLQQSADGVLYGAGRFECMLLHKTGRGDTAGFAFFGNGNQRLFLLIVELVHN